MGMQMHYRDSHAATKSVDFATESRRSTNPKVTRSVVQLPGMEVWDIV